MKPTHLILIAAISLPSFSKADDQDIVKPPVWIMEETIPANPETSQPKRLKVHYVEPILQSFIDYKGDTLVLVNLDTTSDDADTKEATDLLDSGTGVISAFSHILAELIAGMPKECQDKIIVHSTHARTDLIRHLVGVDPKQSRRIRTIKVVGCFEDKISACYDSPQTSGPENYDFRSLRRFFEKCQLAMLDEVRQAAIDNINPFRERVLSIPRLVDKRHDRNLGE